MGKEIRRGLVGTDRDLAKRRLAKLKDDLNKIEETKGFRTLDRARFYAEVLPDYGFGTWNDISPILSTPEAAAAYASKYVSKSFVNRPYDLKGARLVSFGRGIKPGTTRFSSIGGRAGLFREMVGMYCRRYDLEWEDLPTECEMLYAKPNGKYIGHRWAYFLRPDFQRVWEEFASLQPF